MKKFVFAASSVLFCIAVLFAAPAMREGKWEISMSINMPGMPFALPAVTHTQCITKEDLKDNKNTVPSAGKDDDCEVKNYKVRGNTVTWETVCKDGTKGSGEITYKGDSYTGKMKMETIDEKSGKKTNVDYKIKGQRKGDC